MRKQTATVVADKGKYFVKVGDQKHQLIPNSLGGEKAFETMVNQEVEVILSEPELIAVFVRKPQPGIHPHCFICYKPIDIFKDWMIDPAIQEQNLKIFLEKGLISQEVFDAQMKTINQD